MNRNVFFSAILAIALFGITIPAAHAELVLDSISVDPAIIVGGDTVDIIIQYHDQAVPMSKGFTTISNPEYTFGATISPDDDVSRQYITFLDSEGDNLKGMIYGGTHYNKKYRVKIAEQAPPGPYQLRLVGQWYKNNVPVGSAEFVRFTIDVKRKGATLTLSNIVSLPPKIRVGDKNILLKADLINTGEKVAKNVNVALTYPSGMSSSFTGNNVITVGKINPLEHLPIELYIDTDLHTPSGVYNISYVMTYEDLDANAHVAQGSFPVVLKKKPHLIVTCSHGSFIAGGKGELIVTIKNIGEEKAESADVRLIKESSQPFTMDVRSDYIGPLAPGESGTAVFAIDVLSEAAIKEHKLMVVLRGTGDSQEDDNQVYTFTDSATLSVDGKKKNYYPLAGIGIAIVAVIGIVIHKITNKKQRKA